MKRAPNRWSLVAVVVTIAACGSHAQRTGSSATSGSAAGRDLPVVELAVWPEQWPRVIKAVPAVAEALRGGPDATSVWSIASLALGELGFEDVQLPPPGLDSRSPITLAIYRAHSGFETIALGAARGTFTPTADTAVRLRITLPAKDATVLGAAVDAVLAKHSATNVAVVRGADAIAIDVYAPGSVPAAHAGPPAIRSVPFDPGTPSAARFILRADGIAEAGASYAMGRVAEAFASMNPSEPDLLAEGLAETLTGFVLADPATSMAEALVVDVPTSDDPPRVAFAASKTGVAALAAAGLKPGSTTPIDHVDWNKAAAAVEVNGLMRAEPTSDKDATRRVATLFAECGSYCFAYIALGNALQLGKAMQDSVLEQARSLAGGGDGVQLRWGDGDMISLARGEAKDLARPPLATPSAHDTCLRTALIGVRSGLQLASEKPAALEAAIRSLDEATSCATGDAAFTARQTALHDALVALRTKMAATPKRGDRPSARDEDPPPPRDTP